MSLVYSNVYYRYYLYKYYLYCQARHHVYIVSCCCFLRLYFLAFPYSRRPLAHLCYISHLHHFLLRQRDRDPQSPPLVISLNFM